MKIDALTVVLILLFLPSVSFSEVRKTYYESTWGGVKDEYTYENGKKEGPYKRDPSRGKEKKDDRAGTAHYICNFHMLF